MGCRQFKYRYSVSPKNLLAGNWSAASVDAVGVLVDGTALAIPFVPGGASIALNASRTASSAVDRLQLGKQLASESQLAELAAGGGKVLDQPADQASRIAAEYGINANDVQKVASGRYRAKDDSVLTTHAFRDASTNKVIQPKTKVCIGSRIKKSSC